VRVLIVGGGGREHALAWKVAQSAAVSETLVAPGNAGSALEDGVRNIPIAADDVDALLAYASAESIDLTIIGPEAPLVAGIVDRFSAAGLPCFGPGASAARLEGSKDFTKRFLDRHGIPTATFRSFTDLDQALAYVDEVGAPIVIKADGLAAGKGVVVATSRDQAMQAVRDMLGDGQFGDAGRCVVIEEFLQGEEASFIVMTDGKTVLPLATSQDHKARDNGDTGPNTGGMGAYSPAPVVTAELKRRVLDEIIHPTLDGLAAEGIPYCGFLYAGLMITPGGEAKVLEYNCRFGDPETQPIMMRLNSDLVALCMATLDGTLASQDAEWDPRAAVGVVMAAGGYPSAYEKGQTISGLEDCDKPDCKVFHAGTSMPDGRVVTSGGRVLCVVGLGESVSAAQAVAYTGVAGIQWQDEFHRDDIGYRAVERE
jgi:phosphoribosylamine--glycine ligase